MVKYLVYIGLAVCPFLTLQGHDQRLIKGNFALGLCLIMALFCFLFKGFKRSANPWLPLFIAWSMVSTFFVPVFIFNHNPVDALWNFRPLFCMMVFFLSVMAVADTNWSDKAINRVFKIIAYSGMLMAFLVILQGFFGIDPLFHVKSLDKDAMAPSPNMAGTLGHPTFVGAFMVLCIGFAWHLRKWLAVAMMIVALVACKSAVPLCALGCVAALYWAYGSRTKTWIAMGALVLCGIVAWHFNIIHDSGRFLLWQTILSDMIANPHTFMTGFGIGSFQYIYPIMHPSISHDPWLQAHNEYLEVLWGTGIPGIFLMYKGLAWPMQKAWHNKDAQLRILFCAWIAICLCAIGNFVWHLGVFCLYSAVIYGCMSNKVQRKFINTGGKICTQ